MKKSHIKHFKGVFMRDDLKTDKINKIECGIINLDSIFSKGTYWTCYKKIGNKDVYFDSYSEAPPPLELQKYFEDKNIFYSIDNIQTYEDPPICGHLCLEALRLFLVKI